MRTARAAAANSGGKFSSPASLKIVPLRLAFDSTAPHRIMRPLATTPVTRRTPPAFSTTTFSTSTRLRTSTPLRRSSSDIFPMSRSVPPRKVYTPLLMKLENTMPNVMAGSSSVEPLA